MIIRPAIALLLVSLTGEVFAQSGIIQPGIPADTLPAKAQPAPRTSSSITKAEQPAKFLVQDIYCGLSGVKHGDVKWLRVIETITPSMRVPPGGRWWKQAFLVSWQGGHDLKNVLGIVPVESDGSVCFEAPPDKDLYFQALDQDKRLVQSMRTGVQALPGVTRSCTGCHVPDEVGDSGSRSVALLATRKAPARIQRESWGSGAIDYPTMIQPVLDRYCVRCHGGEDGIAMGLDYSGGWTWAFNISYETLLKNTLTGFIRCENGKMKKPEILSPRTHGSAVAAMAEQLLGGHHGRIRDLPRRDIELLLAWMDGNCNYYGTGEYTAHSTCEAILKKRKPLLEQMEVAGCLRCHEKEIGFDWVNLAAPEQSRMLRAPLAKGEGSLNWCRDRKAPAVVMPLLKNDVESPDVFHPFRRRPPDRTGESAPTFADTSAPGYRAICAIIEEARHDALQAPRVDMPGAKIIRREVMALPQAAPQPAGPRGKPQ